MDLDIPLLRTFIAVSKMGGMTAAGNTLGLTQGAVSQHIKRLEEALGHTLFDRTRRQLSLTNTGARFVALAEKMLALNDQIVSAVRAPDACGIVRLGIPYDLVTPYLSRALDGFAAANPNVDIDLHCNASPTLIDMVNDAALDIAIVEEPTDDIKGICLKIERLIWVGKDGGLAHAKRPLPLSIVSKTCAFRPAIHIALRRAGIEWRSVFENGNIDATMATVRSDMAITASLTSLIPGDVIPIGSESGLPPLPSFSISLYAQKTNPGSALETLTQHIQRTCG